MTAQLATEYVLTNFATVTEQQIGQFERNVAQASPESDERALLYSLRVSKSISTARSFQTVQARWWLAEHGPKNGGAAYVGLERGGASPNYQRTCDFLTRLYTDRVEELCRVAVTKAENDAETHKARAAKCKTFQVVCDELEAAQEKLAAAAGKIEEAFLEAPVFFSGERRDAWCDYLSSKQDELAELCLKRLEESCGEIVAKAEKDAVNRKTESARCNVLYAAIDRIKEAADQAVDFDADTKVWIDRLQNKLKALGPEKLENATCDGCGNWPRVLKKIESGQYVCRTCLREIRG